MLCFSIYLYIYIKNICKKIEILIYHFALKKLYFVTMLKKPKMISFLFIVEDTVCWIVLLC